MLKPQDILVAIAGATLPGGDSHAAFGARLGLSASQAHSAWRRLQLSRLASVDREINRANLHEFMIHGMRFLYPMQTIGLVMGRPTGAAHPALLHDFPEPEVRWVWPDGKGKSRGMGIAPFTKFVIVAAANDDLYLALALVELLRGGSARERTMAAERLRTLWEGTHGRPTQAAS